jgi:hypothetical protein
MLVLLAQFVRGKMSRKRELTEERVDRVVANRRAAGAGGAAPAAPAAAPAPPRASTSRQRVPLCAATSSAARRPAMMIRLNDADRPALHAWMASELAAM